MKKEKDDFFKVLIENKDLQNLEKEFFEVIKKKYGKILKANAKLLENLKEDQVQTLAF